jgi:hypothetical protein
MRMGRCTHICLGSGWVRRYLPAYLAISARVHPCAYGLCAVQHHVARVLHLLSVMCRSASKPSTMLQPHMCSVSIQ